MQQDEAEKVIICEPINGYSKGFSYKRTVWAVGSVQGFHLGPLKAYLGYL